MSKVCTLLAKAISSYLRNLSSFIDTLPDGTKIKPWADLIAWPVTLFAAVIGLMSTGAGLYEIYTRNISRLDDEQSIRNSRANVLVSISIDSKNAVKRVIDSHSYMLTPVHIRVENKSPNDYSIPLRSSRWIVNGVSMTRQTELKSSTDNKWTAEVGIGGREAIASGYAFLDNSLPPSEVLTRDILIFVPDKKYTHLEAGVSFPIISNRARKRLLDEKKLVKITYAMDTGSDMTPLPPQETLLEYDVLVCEETNGSVIMGRTEAGSCTSYRGKTNQSDYEPIRSLGFLMRISSTERAIQ